jgi:hypothetical protein
MRRFKEALSGRDRARRFIRHASFLTAKRSKITAFRFEIGPDAMRTETLAVLLAMTTVSACGQIEPVRVMARGAGVPVMAVLDAPPAGAADLGQVTATTCMNRIWDRRMGWDAALDAVKEKAAAKGANALAGVRYEEGNVMLCTSSLKVSATALKVP